MFEGGPMTFEPRLIQVFAERLHLSDEEILIPEHPEIMVAYGAALSIKELFEGAEAAVNPSDLARILEQMKASGEDGRAESAPVFFASEKERQEFEARHRREMKTWKVEPGVPVRAYLGIDSGSTTTKFVLMDEEEHILDSFYASNAGEPLEVARRALLDLRNSWRARGNQLEILAVGTTGYGELLFEKAFCAEYHTVETVAHARAASRYVPDLTFLLDIGGYYGGAVPFHH